MDPTSFLDHHYPAPLANPRHWTFREYMEACMFDPAVGYYGSGKVRIGLFADYWTYPVRLSPLFGELLGLRTLSLWRAMRERVEAAGEPFRLVEVGGGRGELLRDTVLSLRRRAESDDAARALVERLELIAVDKSAALLADQQTAQEALPVRHVSASATELDSALPQPFYGLIFANELLTQLSVELLRIDGGVGRLRILPWVNGDLTDLTVDGAPPHGFPADLRPLRPDALPELIRRLGADEPQLRRFAERDGVRWTGFVEPVADGDLLDYARRSAPVVARLARAGLAPAWVAFAPEVGRVLDGIARVLGSGAGGFLTVDYGGTAWHVFDPGSVYTHLRTFSRLLDGDSQQPDEDEYYDKSHDPLRSPGCEDLTYDLDFTWAAERLAEGGLELAFYGHQGALEAGVDLWKAPFQAQLVLGRAREGYGGAEAFMRAHDLLKRFRSGGGFQTVAVTSPGLAAAFEELGPGDPVRRADLAALGEGWSPALAQELEVDPSLAERCAAALHAGGSPVDDLSDEGLYAHRWAVLAALRRG